MSGQRRRDGLSAEEEEAIKHAIAAGYYDHTATDRVCTAVERIVARREAAAAAEAVEKALREAADAVRDCRENGMPEGCLSHPYAEGFEIWLRDRADREGRS